MAITKATRRPSVGQSPAAKKARHSNDVEVRCYAVKKALASAEHLPQAARNLLTGSVHTCLGTYQADRHAYQISCVKMIQETLEAIAVEKKKEVAEAQAAVDEVDKEKDVLLNARGATEKALSELQAALEATKAKQDEAGETVKGAQAAVQKAKAEQKEGDARTAAAVALKDTLDKAEGKLAGFKAVAADSKAINEVLSVCKKVKMDETLLEMIPAVFKKKVEDRGTFDNMAIQQLETLFAEHSKQLADQVQDPEAVAAARAAVVNAALTAEAAAKEVHVQSNTAVAEANAACKGGKTAVTEADSKVKACEKRREGLDKELGSAKAALSKHQDETMTSFKYLLELTLPVEPEVTPAEPTAPAEVADAGSGSVASA